MWPLAPHKAPPTPAAAVPPLPEPLTEEVQRRGLPWQLAQDTLNAVFAYLTVFGSVFVLFLGELGLPKAQIGLLLSLLPFSGLVALWFAPVATRLGWRRVFIWLWAVRKFVIAGLLLLPWVTARYGPGAALGYLIAVVAGFAVLRALAETAWYPWKQEIVPDSLRGRFAANSAVLSTLASCLALVIAGEVIRSGSGLGRFLVLIGAGCVVGLVGVLVMIPMPGGKPRAPAPDAEPHLRSMGQALRDRNFVLYLAGLGCLALGTLSYLAFLPLFLKEKLGVAPGTVVTLDTSVMIGGALSALLWGRAADRVGSRPVLLSAVALTCLVPVGWLLLPRHAAHLSAWCALLYFVQGVATNGVSLGAGRLLLNGVVPPERSTAYTAIFYSWQGLAGGAAPLLAGALLQHLETAPGQLAGLALDPHSLLFALAVVLAGAGGVCYSKVRPDDRYRTRDVLRALAERVWRRLPG